MGPIDPVILRSSKRPRSEFGSRSSCDGSSSHPTRWLLWAPPIGQEELRLTREQKRKEGPIPEDRLPADPNQAATQTAWGHSGVGTMPMPMLMRLSQPRWDVLRPGALDNWDDPASIVCDATETTRTKTLGSGAG